MSDENDLGPGSIFEYAYKASRNQEGRTFRDGVMQGMREAVRRAKADPWQLFDDNQLIAMQHGLIYSEDEEAIKSELERRKSK